MAFLVARRDMPAIEVRVNFGLFAGRAPPRPRSTELAAWLLDEVGAVTIISEERHELERHAEASVHQVRIELAAGRVPGDSASGRSRTAPRARRPLGALLRLGPPRRDLGQRLEGLPLLEFS